MILIQMIMIGIWIHLTRSYRQIEVAKHKLDFHPHYRPSYSPTYPLTFVVDPLEVSGVPLAEYG